MRLAHLVGLLCFSTATARRDAQFSKRRRAIELVLAKAKHFLAIEAALEASERWDRSQRLAKYKQGDVSEVRTLFVARNFTYEVPNPKKLQKITAVNRSATANGTKLTLRAYFRRGDEALSNRQAYKDQFGVEAPVARDRTSKRVFGGESERTMINWGIGGYAAVGRVLGVAFVPVRAATEALRGCVCRPVLAATERLGLPLVPRLARAADALLSKGLVKGLPEVHPRLDPRYGRLGAYYNYALRFTTSPRTILRVAWRTPVDVFRWVRRVYYAAVLGHGTLGVPRALLPDWPSHERLEAALLRAAIAEAQAYLGRLGPRAAARRRRRVAARDRKLAAEGPNNDDEKKPEL